MPIIYVYGIKDPDSQLFRYIGATTNLVRRRAQHYNPGSFQPALAEWLRRMKQEGRFIEFCILHQIDAWIGYVYDEDHDWIELFLKEGHPLLNRRYDLPNRYCPHCKHAWHTNENSWPPLSCTRCHKKGFHWYPGPQMLLFALTP